VRATARVAPTGHHFLSVGATLAVALTRDEVALTPDMTG
jgi:hypothetical protein